MIQGHPMNSHNTKPAFAFHKTPGVTKDDKQRVKAVSKTLADEAKLAIADDDDAFCDPYNSTGKHVILKARLMQQQD
jgi:hypothetical protein